MYCCYSVLHNVRETGAGYKTSHSDIACALVFKTVQYMGTSVCCDSARALQHNVLCGGKKTWGQRWGLNLHPSAVCRFCLMYYGLLVSPQPDIHPALCCHDTSSGNDFCSSNNVLLFVLSDETLAISSNGHDVTSAVTQNEWRPPVIDCVYFDAVLCCAVDHRYKCALRCADYCEGEGSVLQCHITLNQGQAEAPFRGRSSCSSGKSTSATINPISTLSVNTLFSLLLVVNISQHAPVLYTFCEPCFLWLHKIFSAHRAKGR